MNENYKNSIGEKLKKIRLDNNMSMDKLAKSFNNKYDSKVSKSMISNWENNKNVISAKNLSLYADYFDIPMSYILNKDRETLDFKLLKRIYEVSKKYSKYYKMKSIKNSENEINKEVYKNDINKMIDKLNILGLQKVGIYCEDLLKINDYLLNEFKKDD